MNLNDSVKTIKGVGNARCEKLKKLKIETVSDILYHFPRKYEDRRTPVPIINAPFNEDVLLLVKVVTKRTTGNPYSRHHLLRVQVEDDTGTVELLFFNAKYLNSYFVPGEEISLFGKILLNNGRKQMSHPEFHKSGAKDDIRGLFPVYPLTDGITQAQMRSLVLKVKPMASELTEWLPTDIVDENNLCGPEYAVMNIHFPVNERSVLEAKFRLVFEELLILQTGLFYIKNGLKSAKKGLKMKHTDLSPLKRKLGFELTAGQERALNEIVSDLESEKPMNRLVQGDVGSGKTAVAELAMYKTVKSGYQAVMMVPTELLAKQHIAALKADFEPLGIRCELLSGSMSKKERDSVLNDLSQGKIDILIGTHAIIQPDVRFKNLGLAVTDEQHRFGVNQRTVLSEKATNPNVLVMTATPIPRTLAVILYGDLDISVIDTLPNGRMPVRTYLRYRDSREKIYDFVETEVKKGRQAYVVCPLIDESEMMDLMSAEEIYERLRKRYADLKIGLVHGKMMQDEKDGIMLSFSEGLIDILVSTVVIEVGINVPNATVMVIENCERFGLSELHQLRGRVGRGREQSYCILISGSDSEIARKRNQIMCNTNDGFVIAEEDLKLRGPGEIFGTRQHGIPELHIADLIKNIGVLEKVKSVASGIIEEDPELSSEKYSELRKRIIKLFGENIQLRL